MHWMTYEYFGGKFHCGRPWHPYGIAARAARLRRRSRARRAPRRRCRTPSTTATPRSRTTRAATRSSPTQSKDNLTYEGMYCRWIERVWIGRPAADGHGRQREPRPVRAAGQPRAELQRDGHDAPRLQGDPRARRTTSTRRPAGPGKGFFQIVTDPFEARRVINQGRMAVVLEIETSEPFDCRGWEQADAATRRRSTASSTRCTGSASARRCCSTSSTTR